MEQFDILDCRGVKTGRTIARDDAHRAGVWHGAFHCLIIGAHEGRRHALFQLRSSEKKIAPGKFDVTVGGHYAAGEDASSAGPREIREEIGIDVSFDALRSLGRRVFVYCFSQNIEEYEFQDVFLLRRDAGFSGLTPQNDELAGVMMLDVDQGISLLSGSIAVAEAPFLTAGNDLRSTRIKAGDFVPGPDNYYLKLLLLARRYFNGERDLLLI